jgi:tetratricopeptide (TPR) repeat protein
MDIGKAFEAIQEYMKECKYDEAKPIINEIAKNAGDPYLLFKCASILKAAEDEKGCHKILDRVAAMPFSDVRDKLAVAASLRSLGRPEDAYSIIKGEEEDDKVLREKARSLLAMGKGDLALPKAEMIRSPAPEDGMLLTNIFCSIGKFDKALEAAERLAADEGGSYDSLANLCAALMLMGREKDAVKMAKQRLKGAKGADPFALAAYVMRINGRTSAAAAFAHRALSIDHFHCGALETMALCLIEKSHFSEAKLCAGMINEKKPGDPAAIRIIDACRHASK